MAEALVAAPVPPPLLRVAGLARYFDASPPLVNRLLLGARRRVLKAVDGVSFAIPRGKTFSLVGESGCGKSTVARLIVGLYRPTRGSIEFDGQDLARLQSAKQLRAVRRRFQIIFQDPFASLNPRWRVRDIIAEPIRVHGLLRDRAAIRARTGELLAQVGLGSADGGKYPHEFSGGQRQRISIARALASNPEFLVCDEPTSALDVSVQAQILNLMKELQERLGLTYLFISHNLAVVHHMSDQVGVMYLGRLCRGRGSPRPSSATRAIPIRGSSSRPSPTSSSPAARACRSRARCRARSIRRRAAASIRAAPSPTSAAGASGRNYASTRTTSSPATRSRRGGCRRRG